MFQMFQIKTTFYNEKIALLLNKINEKIRIIGLVEDETSKSERSD